MEQLTLSVLRLKTNSAVTLAHSVLAKRLSVLVVIASMAASGTLAAQPLPEETSAQQPDITVIKNARHGMATLLTYISNRPDLFPRERPAVERVPGLAERQEVRDIWARFLDYQLSLDSVDQKQGMWETGKSDATFAIGYASFLARYRYAMDFIALVDNDPAVRIALNEEVPELGLPTRSYADFKFHYLNVAIAARFAALAALNHATERPANAALASEIRDDEQEIWRAAQGKGLHETASNAVQVTKHVLFKTIFPVQKNVSEWMGDTRVLNGERYYVLHEQVDAIAEELKPGDILLQRREWFLSNLGLPGFWSHAALYVGSPEERAAYFDDPSVSAWLAGMDGEHAAFDALLQNVHPEAYRKNIAMDAHGHQPRVLEAISEGVVFTSREHLATTDSLVVLRPRLSKVEIAKALQKAFGYNGRPYDFDFDFRTDTELVCTELVFKAYEPELGVRGIRFPLHSVAGRPVITANDIARQFDHDYGKPEQQLDLVLFLDGNEGDGKASKAGLDGFRASWRRPKWHILTQNTPFASR